MELLLRISPYSVRMRENVDQNNAEYGQFLRSVSDNSYFEISRPYVKNHDDESLKIYELHGFIDANPKAYGAFFLLSND